MPVKPAVYPAAFRAALEATKALIKAGDVNGDGSVQHIELRGSPKMNRASGAARNAAELVLICAANRGMAHGATPADIDGFARYIGSDAFLDLFSRSDGSLSDVKMRRARRSNGTDAGDAAAAVVVLARDLMLKR